MNRVSKTDDNIAFFENEYCKMEIKDNILYCAFRPFLEMTLEAAISITKDRIAFTKGQSYPMLSDISNLKYITKEAREYLASSDGIKSLTICAYVATTQIEKFLWEMFLKINRPSIPSRLFINKREALAWLDKDKK